MANETELVIKKVKKVYAADAGGAWKIALADFMTALMIVFFTLWTTANKSDADMSSLADYFKGKDVSPDEAMKLLEATYTEIREILFDQRIIITLDKNNKSITIQFDSDMLFESGSPELKAEAVDVLANFTQSMKEKNFFYHIYGYSDAIPMRKNARFNNNLELSLLRALSAGNVLNENGISADLMTIHGEGVLNPVDAGVDVEALKKNRRVEIYMTYSSAPSKVYGTNVKYIDVESANAILQEPEVEK
ncbi:OmpA/MotB family protein [Vibrio crassostreae]|uniref:OmpA/MotB family protein n=1 Tax=Vibrio crassostreae TaxID=246167 RepID=UPI001B316639|nr:OmpA family protein [Vibrio crassostreae]